jgi:hypothetical protein
MDQRFVRADNKVFQQEINQENNAPIMSERALRRAGSTDSLATNRASLGVSDTNSRAGDFDNDHFEISNDGQDTELMDMSQTIIPPQNYVMPQPVPDHRDVESPTLGRDETPLPELALDTDGASRTDARTYVSDISRTVTPGEDESPRAPEMQERGGSLPLIARAQNGAQGGKGQMFLMDLDIPSEER